MRHILIRDDGGISVAPPSEEVSLERVLEIWPELNPGRSILRVEQVEDDQIPADRTFRDAWRHSPETGVRHCIDAAKEILKDRMRTRRAERFDEMRVTVERSVLEGRDLSAVSAWAQDLRDVTKHPDLEAAQTVEELKAVWPEVLESPVPGPGVFKLGESADPLVTQSITDWANGLENRLSGMEAAVATLPAASTVDIGPIADELAKLKAAVGMGATMKDVQGLAAVLDALARRLAAMETTQQLQASQLKDAAERVDFVMKEGAGIASLTQEELS